MMAPFRSPWSALALACLCLRLAALPAQPPAWAARQPIYEVNPEMYAEKACFKAITKDLPRIKKLGVGIVWLMPIHPRGVLKGINSPYCILDHKGIYAPYGSAADLRALVKTAHHLGLHVILDWVGNHSSFDNPLTKSHPDFYVHDAKGAIASVGKFADIAQFDYANPRLRAWMTDAMAYWVKNFGVDGFRCDMAWNVPVDYWQEARARLEKIKPVFMLAEANSPQFQGAFDADYDWNLMPASPQCDLTRVARGKQPPTIIAEDLDKEIAYAVPPDFYRLRYTSNHDEFNDVGPSEEILGDADKALAVLMLTLPGKPLIYNGQELGWTGRNPGPKTGWNRPADPLLDFTPTQRAAWYTDFTTRLLRLHQAMPQERNEVMTRLSTDGDCHIYSYLRRNSRDKVLVVLNLSADPAHFRLLSKDLPGDYHDLYSGAALHVDAAPMAALVSVGLIQAPVSPSASALSPSAAVDDPGAADAGDPNALAGLLSGTAAAWEYHVFVSGPDFKDLLASYAKVSPPVLAWDPVQGPVQDKPCPTPVVLAQPITGRVPYSAACGALSGDSGWQPLNRLVMGVNPDGVSGRFRAHWDEQALSIEVEVQDPACFTNRTEPWEDSSVELYLNMSHQHLGDFKDGDYQYIFTVGRPQAFEAGKHTDGVVTTSSKSSTTWSVQASVPWATLKVKPAPNAIYGFDLGVDFNQDGSGRQGQLVWHGGAENYHDTRLYSDIVLAPCKP